jgi:hypothetical protein
MHTIELIIHFCLAEKYEFIINPIDHNIGDEGTTPRSSPLAYLLWPKNKMATQSPRSSRLIRVHILTYTCN